MAARAQYAEAARHQRDRTRAAIAVTRDNGIRPRRRVSGAGRPLGAAAARAARKITISRPWFLARPATISYSTANPWCFIRKFSAMADMLRRTYAKAL